MKATSKNIIGAITLAVAFLSQAHAGNNPTVDAALGATLEPMAVPLPIKKAFLKNVIVIENAQDSTSGRSDLSSQSAAKEFEAELNSVSKRQRQQ